MPRKQMPDMKKTSILMPIDLLKGLNFLAKRRGTTYSQLLRDITREYVVKSLMEERAIAQAQQHDRNQSPAPAHEPEPSSSGTSNAGESASNDGNAAVASDGP